MEFVMALSLYILSCKKDFVAKHLNYNNENRRKNTGIISHCNCNADITVYCYTNLKVIFVTGFFVKC